MFDRSIAGASRSRQATLSLGAAAAAAIFIQSASAGVTLSNWYGSSGNPTAGGWQQVSWFAVKFTTGSGNNWELTSIRARCDGSGASVGVQIWTDGATGSDPTGAGASAIAGSSTTSGAYNWGSPTPITFNYASSPVQLTGGRTYWAVFKSAPEWGGNTNTSSFSFLSGSALTPTDNGSGWSLGESIAKHQYTASYSWNDNWSALQGTGFGNDWNTYRAMTPEIEFNATAVAPAPGALALLGVAGLARRRRRER